MFLSYKPLHTAIWFEISQVKTNEMNEWLQGSPGSFLHSTSFNQIRDLLPSSLARTSWSVRRHHDVLAKSPLTVHCVAYRTLTRDDAYSSFRGLAWMHCTYVPLICSVDMCCSQHMSACSQHASTQCSGKWSKLCCISLHMVLLLLQQQGIRTRSNQDCIW